MFKSNSILGHISGKPFNYFTQSRFFFAWHKSPWRRVFSMPTIETPHETRLIVLLISNIYESIMKRVIVKIIEINSDVCPFRFGILPFDYFNYCLSFISFSFWSITFDKNLCVHDTTLANTCKVGHTFGSSI